MKTAHNIDAIPSLFFGRFVHKRDLLPMLKFPGEFHAASNSMHIKTRRAFTMKSFLDLNSGRSRIFLGGRLSYTDMEFEETYTLSPMGLASEFKQVCEVYCLTFAKYCISVSPYPDNSLSHSMAKWVTQVLI